VIQPDPDYAEASANESAYITKQTPAGRQTAKLEIIRMNLVHFQHFESFQCGSLLVRRLFGGAAIR
jgi:hypothetical protein